MFGIGPTELVIIAVIAVLLFGSRLPKLMYSLGNGIVQFKRGIQNADADEEREREEREDRELSHRRRRDMMDTDDQLRATDEPQRTRAAS